VKHGARGENPASDFKNTKRPLLLTWQALGVEPTPDVDKKAPPCDCPKPEKVVPDSLSSSQLEVSRALLAAQDAKVNGQIESWSNELTDLYRDLSTTQSAEKSSEDQIATLEARDVGQLTAADQSQVCP
jgi:hypothetical protein